MKLAIPKFIYFDAGDVLIERLNRYQDKIAAELEFDPEDYDRIIGEAIAWQPAEESAQFAHIRTLEEEYAVIRRFHERLLEYLSIDFDPDLIQRLTEYRIKADFRLKHGVLEAVDRLSQKYKLGVLSNALPSRRHFELKLENIDQYFDPIVLSWEEGIQKPSTELYHIAVQKSGHSAEEILFVDNKVSYLEGARNAGIHNLVLLKAGEENADYIMIDSLLDLADMLS